MHKKKMLMKRQAGGNSEKHGRVSKKEASGSSTSKQGGKLEGRMKEQEAASQ